MKTLSLLLCLCGLSICGDVMSEPKYFSSLNIGFGGMLMDDIHHIDTVDYNYDVKGIASGVTVGIWTTPQLLKHYRYGVELGFFTYDDNTYSYGSPSGQLGITDGRYTGHHFDLLSFGRYYFNDNISFLVKGGLAYVTQELATNGINYNGNQSKILPKVAFGIGYDFSPEWGADIIFSYVFGNKPTQFGQGGSKDDYNRVASVNLLTIGCVYYF